MSEPHDDTGSRDSRFPRWVYGVGDEPDPRFSLANERTFLAWIRTSLALVAGGVALEAVAAPMDPTLRLGAAILLVALGAVGAVQAWLAWARTERALRRHRALPGNGAAPLLVLGLLVVIVLIALGLTL
ncbi:putative membrane protein [Knoellia remsis]|uniref:Putative membrane protein n=1 Tax=Knoellia remsis TaxID=407159 RepID=A0A2T0U4Y3_9MICO|nr:DUF202 domain-containing protein [Knoellia remsis]PRY52952.1 putative membrane protein [Knoellia remsis]